MDSHLVHYSAQERPFVQNMENCVQRVSDKHTPYLSDFFDPRQIQLAEQVTRRMGSVQFESFGGYPGAERRRVLLFPDYFDPQPEDWELTVLKMRIEDPKQSLTHGDYLGALTGLGVKRSKYGDISVTETGAQLIVTSEMFSFVTLHLRAVGRTRVSTSEQSLDQFAPPHVTLEERTFTVATPRLDAILSDAVRVSRAKILEPIRAGKVQVNWRQAFVPSELLKVGDVISVRGFGRIRILEMEGLSKKGRLFVKIGKYM